MFFDHANGEMTQTEIEQKLIELSIMSIKRSDVEISSRAPNDNEVGALMSSENIPDRWIIASSANYDKYEIERDTRTLQNIAALGTQVLDHLAIQEKLHKAARIDALTGLANRRMLTEVLERDVAASQRHEGTVGLLFIDIDGFKPVNDTHGHKAGDDLLQMIARRLVKTVRDEDFVARLGGDEFVVLCRNVSEEAIRVCLVVLLRKSKNHSIFKLQKMN